MTQILKADASPEKRLFISLITRDIPLIAAFLDLVDNSINAAVEPSSHNLETAENYVALFQDPSIAPTVNICLKIEETRVEIADTASGISSKTAQDHVFKFGRADSESHTGDRLSVYGIGLKRALFKLGNKIEIVSDHVEGGFDLSLDVASWEKDHTLPWTFDITPRPPVSPEKTGTRITVTELYDDSVRRISDGIFIGQLKTAISSTYAFYMAKFTNIFVNDQKIEGTNIEVGDNYASDEFVVGDVSCAITAGIGTPQGGGFRDRSSGWFVFCNGRTVIAADKSPLTGWGAGSLPIFQPKHRPFLGTVFFVSKDAEKLPWNTTKSGINEDSSTWQEAKRHMTAIGRQVVTFLDGRYTDEGTEVASLDLQEAAGTRVSVITAAVPQKKSFSPPAKPKPTVTKIQYDVKVEDLKKIEDYLRTPGMGGAEVGRFTFNFFLRNEVGE